jgi:hypothetical protein
MVVHVNSVEEAVADLKQRQRTAIRKAVSKAGNQAVDDVYKFSISCIDRYYANYIPSIYDRTGQLYNTVSPVLKLAESGDIITTTVGVKFDAGALGSHEHRTFWGTQPGVDNGYEDEILDDFLEGIHPMTNGSPDKGTSALMIQDGLSTDSLLIRYLSMYQNKFAQLVGMYFAMSF